MTPGIGPVLHARSKETGPEGHVPGDRELRAPTNLVEATAPSSSGPAGPRRRRGRRARAGRPPAARPARTSVWPVVAAALTLAAAAPREAGAHELRPGLLRIHVAADHTVELRLRRPERPAADPPAIEARLAGCALTRVDDRGGDDDPAIERWRGRCGPTDPSAIELRGLDAAGFDVVVDLRVDGRDVVTGLLRPAAPALRLGPADTPSLLGYLRLGVDHILGGIDHLLFVVGLVLLVHRRRPGDAGRMERVRAALDDPAKDDRGTCPPIEAAVEARAAAVRTIGVLTGFTLAHSLTLAAAALGWLAIDPAPIEACIALSLVVLARALALGRPPARLWAFAAACGLLHGLGFAGALAAVGLPEDAVVPALLAFNGGVELGQIAVAAGLLGVLALARHTRRADLSSLLPRVLAPLIGGLAVALLVDRLLVLAPLR